MAKDKDDLPPDSLHAPLCESELSGHEAAERALLDAWSSGRLHHAWLITGPQGIGQATLACRFARFLLARGTRESRGASEPAAAGANLFGAPEPAHPQRALEGQGLSVRVDTRGHRSHQKKQKTKHK